MEVMPRKGHIGIRVGGDGEEKQRFEVPVDYLRHPLFAALFREVEEEFGFEQQGPITFLCGVERFHSVLAVIAGDYGSCDETQRRRHHRRFSYFTGCFGSWEAITNSSASTFLKLYRKWLRRISSLLFAIMELEWSRLDLLVMMHREQCFLVL
ncbi:hypothetical protein J5N97_002312 [Dioscorea zingiberensis]|uniref:Uncharacterized protein n=1 Tax=Dioscorea zingiberensis TaxID=325984 RepID=A0A9D5HPH9_9LILI|nr:hypothetical protein J5N97_002312 [Dioscorea zingiberensis]